MRWILPDFVEDVLPPEAERVECVRRTLIDCAHAYGYALVQPSLLEFADSLEAGAGEDLADHTFKVVDLLSGSLMGIRADMTPQVARIDAHAFSGTGVNRLCYTGSVLHTKPTALNPTREVLQAGVELYGVATATADAEVLCLLLEVLIAAGIKSHDLHVDIGHVGVFEHLTRTLSPSDKKCAQAALAQKEASQFASGPLAYLAPLLKHYGAPSEVLNALPEALSHFKAELALMGECLTSRAIAHSIDLADVPGYHYHSGLVFAVYHKPSGSVLARGGRYRVAIDGSRTATGFSLDMRLVGNCLPVISTRPTHEVAFNEAFTPLQLSRRAKGEVVRITHSL